MKNHHHFRKILNKSIFSQTKPSLIKNYSSKEIAYHSQLG
ncbi:hypothetical protein C240_1047 [Enterococcus sp. 5H]|nr:hypothetical protein [Enterococcus sp. 5H]